MYTKKYKIIEDGIEYNIEEFPNGTKIYSKMYIGKYNEKYALLHRISGPAIIYSNGKKEYYLDSYIYPNITSDEEWLLFQIIT
jgi:hypothetical protein